MKKDFTKIPTDLNSMYSTWIKNWWKFGKNWTIFYLPSWKGYSSVLSYILLFCCLVNRYTPSAECGSSTPALSTREMDWDHHLHGSCCQAVRTLLYAETLYAIHCQFCHTALREIYVLYTGQDSSCEFMRLYAIRFGTSDPGSVVRPSRKPVH